MDPIEQWNTPPFEPTIKDGRIYARGAADDKGQFIIHVNALEAHLATSGACPVNVKFLIEGEEEIGSEHLTPFLLAHKPLLACDAVVVSDTAMFAKGVPSICHGLRGLTYLQVDLRGTDTDLHSGTFGGAVINPAFALGADAGRSSRTRRARSRFPGFYDKVRKLTAAERKAMRRASAQRREVQEVDRRARPVRRDRGSRRSRGPGRGRRSRSTGSGAASPARAPRP